LSGVLFAYTKQKVRKQKHPAIAITGLKSETKPIVSNFSKTKYSIFVIMLSNLPENQELYFWLS